MSIINKMHQGLQESATDLPVLSAIPEKQVKQKVLLFCLISLLLVSAIALSYLIYKQRNAVDISIKLVPATDSVLAQALTLTQVDNVSLATQTPTPTDSVTAMTEQEVAIVNKELITNIELVVNKELIANVEPVVNKELLTNIEPVVNKQLIENKEPIVAFVPPTATIFPEKMAIKKVLPEKINIPKTNKASHLEIKKSILTDAKLANIHLKKAEQALQKGDNSLAAKEKYQALNLKPDLHQVRKTLVLYYYSIGEQSQATKLLKRGAVKFPEYSDFNLMLSRIALKNDDPHKAFLYLSQQPPKVEGHLDYHASYAILAQKFKNYEQAEHLYQGILKYRPNNGRWLMSLAIVQDKQKKESLATENYNKALLQIDLSSKAKHYIQQRLTYLANQ